MIKSKSEAEDLNGHAERLAAEATERVMARRSSAAAAVIGDGDWFVIRAATRQEERAVAVLAEHGFKGEDVYLPCETRWFRLGRVRHPKDWPLIPGYLFVFCRQDQLWRIEKLDAVHAVLRRGCADGQRHAVAVPNEFVAELHAFQVAGEFDKTVTVKGVRGCKGEMVRVAGNSPLAGWVGEIVSAKRNGKLAVLLRAIGSMAVPAKEIEVALHDLEAAE